MTKKFVGFLKKNYFIPIFGLLVFLVGAVLIYQIFLAKPRYVFVKVKMGQGFWWTNTQRPSIWQLESIKKGDVAKNTLGKPVAEVLSKTYYRWYGSDQYDVYLTLHLRVSKNKKTGLYTFDRSPLTVGTPIEIQFPTQDVTGPVIALSENSFEDNFIEKTITLTKKYANPWEYDLIKVGDSYFDGERKVFEVLEKNNYLNSQRLTLSPGYTSSGSTVLEPANSVTVVAKILLRQVNGDWVLGEDQLVVPGRNLNIATSNFLFDNYSVANIK